MAFQPDIVSLDNEAQQFVLVAEAKTTIPDAEFDSTERQLKWYMASMRCPVGLLVTPQRLRIYRDQYSGSPDDSVILVGDFDVSQVFKKFDPLRRDADPAFQTLVQEWLEGLGSDAAMNSLPEELREAAQLYLLPAITHGALRAGHPRVA
jgi:hypothetical protein